MSIYNTKHSWTWSLQSNSTNQRHRRNTTLQVSTPPYSGCVWNYLKLTCDSLSKLLFLGKFRLRFGVTSKDFRSWDSAGCLASDRSAEPYIKIWICTAITIMVPSSLYTTICILWADTMGTTQCQDNWGVSNKQTLILDQGRKWTNPLILFSGFTVWPIDYGFLSCPWLGFIHI